MMMPEVRGICPTNVLGHPSFFETFLWMDVAVLVVAVWYLWLTVRGIWRGFRMYVMCRQIAALHCDCIVQYVALLKLRFSVTFVAGGRAWHTDTRVQQQHQHQQPFINDVVYCL